MSDVMTGMEFAESVLDGKDIAGVNDRLASMGMIGPRESIDHVLASDWEEMQGLGIDLQQIGERIAYIAGAWNSVIWYQKHTRPDEQRNGQPFFARDTDIEGNLIRYGRDITRGPAPQCGFAVDCDDISQPGLGSQGWDIKPINGDDFRKISHVDVHMMRRFGFWGGRETRYRLEPSSMAEQFGIEPGVDYTPTLVEEAVWRGVGSQSIRGDDAVRRFDAGENAVLAAVREAADESIELSLEDERSGGHNRFSMYVVPAGAEIDLDDAKLKDELADGALITVAHDGLHRGPEGELPMIHAGRRSAGTWAISPGVALYGAGTRQWVNGWVDQPEQLPGLAFTSELPTVE